ncbi:uncharacterized protein LOC124808541 [Hydra vulgaris]|uniref:uncharacterized protein LOC124808541 n=1 Tax=Hydra vulgaris TaxID=6087 RepID=UPI001F5F332D|nr:PHD finger protein ALFIN-LIKE 7-like [Hydra vulgaris]
MTPCLVMNPGKTVTIYDIPKIVNIAPPKAVSPFIVDITREAPGISNKTLNQDPITPLVSENSIIPPRLTSKRGRKKRLTMIFTNSPVKAWLASHKKTKTKKKNKKNHKPLMNESKKEMIKSNLATKKTSSGLYLSEDEEYLCIYCFESFANSRSREQWIQCQVCQKWAHEECVPGLQQFNFELCSSSKNL